MHFASVYNTRESAVFEAVAAHAARYPGVADDPDRLADVACVALNRMPAQYICHSTDPAFFSTERERRATQRHIDESVDFAFGYVQARQLMAARR